MMENMGRVNNENLLMNSLNYLDKASNTNKNGSKLSKIK